MRLFDKIASQGPEPIRSVVRDSVPTVFAIDEIARHYFQNDQMEWGGDDYPYAIPPWEICFVEWNLPSWARFPEGDRPCNPSDQIGAMVEIVKDGTMSKLFAAFEQHGVSIPDDVQREATVLATLYYAGFTGGRVIDTQVMSMWFMNDDGFIKYITHGGAGAKRVVEMIGAVEARKVYDNYSHIIALAFTFANCSNVKLDDVTDALQPLPKIMRRLKLPSVKRYTLNIAGHASRPRRDPQEPVQEGIMPFHLCRGHFATYTAERPLFGRHVGRFWIPPHTRGREERGKIEKDYAVVN